MIKINCHWYSNEEVIEALKKKGYTIVHEVTEPDRRGNTNNIWTAIKDGKSEPLESVALKEFHKKPPLV